MSKHAVLALSGMNDKHFSACQSRMRYLEIDITEAFGLVHSCQLCLLQLLPTC